MRRGEREARRGPAVEGVRSFLAVLLPEALRERVAAAAAALRARSSGVAWVRTENLHLTLRFLGTVEDETLALAREAMADTARATAPFTVTVAGLGGFPGSRAPRVVWAGVTAGAEALVALHGRLEAALGTRGIPPEGRPFHPHVTLGRTRSPRGAPELTEGLGTTGEPFGEVRVEAVHLMRSELDPAGARYSALARAVLTGDGEILVSC